MGWDEDAPDGDHWVTVYGVRRRPRRMFITNQGRLFHSREAMTWREFKTTWGPIGEAIVCWRR